MQGAACVPFSADPYLFNVYQLINSTKDSYVAEMPAILDSFYTTITNDHIGVEVGGWWGDTEVAGFSMCRS